MMAFIRFLPLLALPLFALPLFAADYQLCFLNDGPNSGKIEAARAKELQAAHLEHIESMWKSGALESAGPISGIPNARGIFLFSAPPAEAARLAAADPTVLAGALRIDCHTWTGPAGVGRAYRAARALPGFEGKYTKKIGLLMKIVTPGPGLGKPIVSGVLRGGDYQYFVLLDTDQIDAVKAKFPDAVVFTWLHDPHVWDGVEP